MEGIKHMYSLSLNSWLIMLLEILFLLLGMSLGVVSISAGIFAAIVIIVAHRVAVPCEYDVGIDVVWRTCIFVMLSALFYQHWVDPVFLPTFKTAFTMVAAQ